MKEPGYYLPPSSDDLAWLLAERRDALSQYFVLERHTPAVIRRLLDTRERRFGKTGDQVREFALPRSAAGAS